jgi:NADH-quinone oxidoreductase subunit M
MEMINFAAMLPILILLPLIGGLIMLPLARQKHCSPLTLFLSISFAELVLTAGFLFVDFPASSQPLLNFSIPWVSEIGLTFQLSLDRLNYPFLLLSALMFFLCSIYCLEHEPKKPALFVFSFLVLQSTLVGAFLAYDLLLFYIFWEALLIPMALIIGVFGAQRRIYAALKFLLFTVFGSLPMLVAVVFLYLHQFAKGSDLSVQALYGMNLSFDVQFWLFLAFFLAFAVKFPFFPVHSWLPEAHVEAPTEGSVILAAILLKLGGYGLIRFAMPVFPQVMVDLSPLLSTLAVIGIVYASLLCLKQQHVKKLVAYSSIGHMGFVALGALAFNFTGVQGSIYQMLNHGITTGALFFLIGMLYHRSNSRNIDDFGGLAQVAPIYATLFLIATLSSIAVPGMNNFVGEFLVLFGIFKSTLNPHAILFASIAVSGVVLGAGYMLWMYRRIFFGPLKETFSSGFHDLKLAEIFIATVLILIMLVMGILPGPFLRFTAPVSDAIIQSLESKVEKVGTHVRH